MSQTSYGSITISDLTDGLEDLQIGGRNMLYDTNASDMFAHNGHGSRYWSNISTLTNNGEGTNWVQLQDSPVPGVTYGASCVCTALNGDPHFVSFYAGYDRIKLFPGLVYTLSFWAKSNTANAIIGFDCTNNNYWTVNNKTPIEEDKRITITEANEWKRYSFTFIWTPPTEAIKNAIEFNENSTYAIGDYVEYSGCIYQCKTAIITAGAWDSSKWDQITVLYRGQTLLNNIFYMGYTYNILNTDNEEMTPSTVICCAFKLEQGDHATDWCDYVIPQTQSSGQNLIHNTNIIDLSSNATKPNINGYYNGNKTAYGQIEYTNIENADIYLLNHGLGSKLKVSTTYPFFRFGAENIDYFYLPIEEENTEMANPLENNWYELINNNYIITNDTTSISGKTYYKQEPTAGMYGLIPGKIYTFSADIAAKLYSGYVGNENMFLNLYLYWDNSSNNEWTIYDAYNVLYWMPNEYGNKAKDKTTHITYTFKMPSLAKRFYLILKPENISSGIHLIDDYIEINNIKLEEGSPATAWSAAPIDIENNAKTYTDTVTENMVTEDDVPQNLSQLNDDIGYATSEQLEETENKINNNIENIQDTLTNEVNPRIDNIENSISNYENTINDITSNINNLNNYKGVFDYLKVDSNGLNIYGTKISNEQPTAVSVQISGNRINMNRANNTIAWIGDKNDGSNTYSLYIEEAKVLTALQFGNFAFIPRQNGNMSLKYLGS